MRIKIIIFLLVIFSWLSSSQATTVRDDSIVHIGDGEILYDNNPDDVPASQLGPVSFPLGPAESKLTGYRGEIYYSKEPTIISPGHPEYRKQRGGLACAIMDYESTLSPEQIISWYDEMLGKQKYKRKEQRKIDCELPEWCKEQLNICRWQRDPGDYDPLNISEHVYGPRTISLIFMPSRGGLTRYSVRICQKEGF